MLEIYKVIRKIEIFLNIFWDVDIHLDEDFGKEEYKHRLDNVEAFREVLNENIKKLDKAIEEFKKEHEEEKEN